jgi:hypothetical protein
MKNSFLQLFFVLVTVKVFSQVGINTAYPETTLEVVGKPDDSNHYDGILPPRITGDQLSKKIYSPSKKGSLLFVTLPPYILYGQVINILEPGLYYFDGNLWQPVSKQKETIEYQIILTFDHNSEAPLAATTGWSEPVDLWGDKDTYLTSSKSYTIGTKKFGELQGTVTFRKIESNINVKFQLSREPTAVPASEDTAIDISDICTDFGYFPKVLVFMVPENSTNVVPALLQNKTIYFPATNLNMVSTSVAGEAEGYSSRTKPHSK